MGQSLSSLYTSPTAQSDPNSASPHELSVQRTVSSIPRPNGPGGSSACPVTGAPGACPVSSSSESEDGGEKGSERWEYPSPRQFHSALVRKGWQTPEESVDMMVQIHNWLNERAWNEVMRWESNFPNGEQCQLAKFQGRPGDLSPKARWHLFLGKVYPSRFNTTPPFDRHDWVVLRPPPNASTPATLQRYVIDYYSLPDDSAGNPVFSLDVRPALDNWASIWARFDAWKRYRWQNNNNE